MLIQFLVVQIHNNLHADWELKFFSSDGHAKYDTRHGNAVELTEHHRTST